MEDFKTDVTHKPNSPESTVCVDSDIGHTSKLASRQLCLFPSLPRSMIVVLTLGRRYIRLGKALEE